VFFSCLFLMLVWCCHYSFKTSLIHNHMCKNFPLAVRIVFKCKAFHFWSRHFHAHICIHLKAHLNTHWPVQWRMSHTWPWCTVCPAQARCHSGLTFLLQPGLWTPGWDCLEGPESRILKCGQEKWTHTHMHTPVIWKMRWIRFYVQHTYGRKFARH